MPDFPHFPDPTAEGEAHAISFDAEGLAFEPDNPDRLRSWIETVIQEEAHQLRSIRYVFCTDEYLLRINQQYLDHDTYTDIITFPLAEAPDVDSDIFISIDRVRENAETLGVPFPHELHRVIIHGVLHLCGYPDKTPEEAQRMRHREDAALKMIENS